MKSLLPLIMAALFISACSGSDGTNGQNGENGEDGVNGTNGADGTDGKNGLIELSSEAAGANCANGGQQVRVGLDADNDGVLSETETTATSYVCSGTDGTDGTDGTNGTNGTDGTDGTNGTDGYNTLIRITPEPAGANCEWGGNFIEHGVDADNSGSLTASEIEGGTYVCDGIDGYSSLVNLAVEAPGINCVTGGTRVDAGLDADRDGVLATSEIQATTYICNPDDASAVSLVSTPDTATVFNSPEQCYVFGNNLITSMWDAVSNRIVTGDFSRNGYWSFAPGTTGWVDSPTFDTTRPYARTVFVPSTRVIVKGGNSYDEATAASHQVGMLGTDGQISGLQNAVFSDGFNGTCKLSSTSASEFLCFDGSNVRHYATAANNANLQFVKSIALASPPSNANTSFGATFAFDGMYYYLPNDGTSSYSLEYSVFDPTGANLGTRTATGSGAINALFFHWGVGRYSTHDGYGNRRGTLEYISAGVNNGFWDSECFGAPSIYHR